MTPTNDITTTVSAMENVQKACQMLMKAPHYAKMGQDGIYAIVAKAMSLKIDPMEALNGGLYYINGKVGMSSEMMASLIREKGHSIQKDAKSDGNICILNGRRADNGDTWTVSFSVEDAKKAGLMKNMYEKYLSTMLYNRALSLLARQLFPDVIKGAGYCESELKEIAATNLPKEEEIVEPITDEQAQELTDVLFECDEDYQKTVLSFIKEKFKADYINQIPLKNYQMIYGRCLKRRDEILKAKQEDFIEIKE
jgi:hypothetical protein